MARRFIAVLLMPLGVLLAAWLGQYIFPQAALGQKLVAVPGTTDLYTTVQGPESAIVFLFPTKLSIPIAVATYVITVLVAVPLGALLNRYHRASFAVAAIMGALVVIVVMKSLRVFAPFNVDVFYHGQFYQYYGFIGAVAGAWYWLLAYMPSSLRTPVHAN